MGLAIVVYVVLWLGVSLCIERNMRKRGHEIRGTFVLCTHYGYSIHKQKMTESERRNCWMIPVVGALLTLTVAETWL
jgi:hypothetical protein